jgi:hypothetical protein
VCSNSGLDRVGADEIDMQPLEALEMFEPEKFRNYYKCVCGEEWDSTWSCMCNERCHVCEREITPISSEELCLACGARVDEAVAGICPKCGCPVKNYDELQKELAARDSTVESRVVDTVQ